MTSTKIYADERRGLLILARVGVSLLAFLAALAYSAFLLAPVVHSRLPVSDSFPSELEAVGQPYAEWFRWSDAVSGVLIVLSVAGAYRLSDIGAQRFGASCIALTGLASVTDAATTMGCAPSASAACRAKDASVNGLLGQVLEAHTISGLLGFVGAAIGMISLGFAIRDTARPWGTASVTAGFVLSGVGLIDLALLYVQGPFGPVERARDVIVSLWLAGLGVFLLDRSATEPAPTYQRRFRQNMTLVP